jgi:hypothetical protein
MKLEAVLPAHCHARAQRLLAEVTLIRDEMGRGEDGRPAPEITGAQPREVYFEALVAWRKSQRLAEELGVHAARTAPAAPVLRELSPGHVLQLLDAVLATTDAIKQRLAIPETAAEPAIEPARQPSDVLAAVVRVNRELSRALERPFTPSDVYGAVALASTYATRLGAAVDPVELKRRTRPADCYARLESCLEKVNQLIVKAGQQALVARGTPKDIVPGDVYDLASLVVGELAFLHSLSATAAPVHAFEPGAAGHVLPAHVDQLARTLEGQLAKL